MALTPEELQELEALKFEVAKIQNPNLITTREQALARAEEADQGGLEAGPWYMEFAKEMLNPVDMAAGAIPAMRKAAGNLGREAIEQTAGRAVGAAGERQAAIDLVKNPAGLEAYSRGLLEDAASKMGGRIQTKEDALRNLIKGVKGEINPDAVSEVMPKLGAKMAARRAPQEVIGPFGETVKVAGESGPVSVKGRQLLRIKRVADKAAKFGKTDVMNPNAAPRIEGAKRVGDIARRQLYEQAPGSEEILGQMGKDIRLKNYLTGRAAKNPVSALQAKPGTLKESVLAQIDEATGSSLRKSGDRLEQGVADLIKPREFLRPLQAPAELAKVGRRAAIKGGELIGRGAEALSRVPGATAAQDLASFATARGLVNPLATSTPAQPQWTQDDENELAELKRMATELQK